MPELPRMLGPFLGRDKPEFLCQNRVAIFGNNWTGWAKWRGIWDKVLHPPPLVPPIGAPSLQHWPDVEGKHRPLRALAGDLWQGSLSICQSVRTGNGCFPQPLANCYFNFLVKSFSQDNLHNEIWIASIGKNEWQKDRKFSPARRSIMHSLQREGESIF